MGCPELGYVSLKVLKEVKLPSGIGIERDLYFEPKYTLFEYYEKAIANGGISGV